MSVVKRYEPSIQFNTTTVLQPSLLWVDADANNDDDDDDHDEDDRSPLLLFFDNSLDGRAEEVADADTDADLFSTDSFSFCCAAAA